MTHTIDTVVSLMPCLGCENVAPLYLSLTSTLAFFVTVAVVPPTGVLVDDTSLSGLLTAGFVIYSNRGYPIENNNIQRHKTTTFFGQRAKNKHLCTKRLGALNSCPVANEM